MARASDRIARCAGSLAKYMATVSTMNHSSQAAGESNRNMDMARGSLRCCQILNEITQIAIAKCPAATVSETLTRHLRQNRNQLAASVGLQAVLVGSNFHQGNSMRNDRELPTLTHFIPDAPARPPDATAPLKHRVCAGDAQPGVPNRRSRPRRATPPCRRRPGRRAGRRCDRTSRRASARVSAALTLPAPLTKPILASACE